MLKKISRLILACALMIGMIAAMTVAASAETTAEDAFMASGYAKSARNAIKWNSVDGAEGYDVYFAKCGKSFRKVKTTSALKYTKKKLSRARTYKYKVKAFKKVEGKKQYIATAPTIHIAGVKAKYSNAKIVAIKSDNIALTVGDSAKITAKITKKSSKKALLWKRHVSAKIRYCSSDNNVATVNANGQITAVGAGTAAVYAYAANGVSDKINVTVSAAEQPSSKDNNPYLTFSSDNEFTLSTMACSVTGLEASTDKTTWNSFKAEGQTMPSVTAVKDGEKYYVYLRGDGMTALSDPFNGKCTVLSFTTQKDQYVDCSGNVMTLLDYDNPDDVEMDAYAFFMFFMGTPIRTAPELLAETLANYCYYGMFSGCTALKTAPELPAETLSDGCYYEMFMGCSSLKTAPELASETLADSCYYEMFCECTALDTAPELPADKLKAGCYGKMFKGCKALKTAPVLNATELAESCYSGMFMNCESLTNAPALNVTDLADSCYSCMFMNCKSLTKAPALNATKLTTYCYAQMFQGCKLLTEAPDLNSTELAECCYQLMFQDCTSLAEAPELPATDLSKFCYYQMFTGCTSLTKAPDLLAMNLEERCYNQMFKGCSSLTEAPVISATELTTSCCCEMFSGCEGLKVIECESTDPDKFVTIPEGTYSSYEIDEMFYGTPYASYISADGTPEAGKSYKIGTR